MKMPAATDAYTRMRSARRGIRSMRSSCTRWRENRLNRVDTPHGRIKKKLRRVSRFSFPCRALFGRSPVPTSGPPQGKGSGRTTGAGVKRPTSVVEPQVSAPKEVRALRTVPGPTAFLTTQTKIMILHIMHGYNNADFALQPPTTTKE